MAEQKSTSPRGGLLLEPTTERFVDLSRPIHHRMMVHPNHPPVIMGVWSDHDKVAYPLERPSRGGRTEFTSKSMYLSMGDHSGTHVDAPIHFDPSASVSIDQLPLENFYTSAICLDLSHVDLKHDISVAELKAAVDKSGERILPGDTVLIHMGLNDRLEGRKAWQHDFPWLGVDAVHWLADQGIRMFGVEAVSPATEGEGNWQAHIACAERGITHMEAMCNLDKLVGRGRFQFAGFPLKIEGGTGGPMRAVAIFPEKEPDAELSSIQNTLMNEARKLSVIAKRSEDKELLEIQVGLEKLASQLQQRIRP